MRVLFLSVPILVLLAIILLQHVLHVRVLIIGYISPTTRPVPVLLVFTMLVFLLAVLVITLVLLALLLGMVVVVLAIVLLLTDLSRVVSVCARMGFTMTDLELCVCPVITNVLLVILLRLAV